MKVTNKLVEYEATQWIQGMPWLDGMQPCIWKLTAGLFGNEKRLISEEEGPAMMTPAGPGRVCNGDWILTGPGGEKYLCKPEVFEKDYMKVEEPCQEKK